MGVDTLPFLQNGTFDSGATQVMGEAYDKARKMLHDKGQPEVVQEVIARRIVEVAMTGERDPDQLAKRALQAFGIEIES
jgi:glyoxylate carboligase